MLIYIWYRPLLFAVSYCAVLLSGREDKILPGRNQRQITAAVAWLIDFVHLSSEYLKADYVQPHCSVFSMIETLAEMNDIKW